MSLLYDRVKMTTATTGTGTITLGSASSGYRSFASASVPNATIVSYTIEDGTDWECGTGTYTVTGTTLSRTLLSSSTGSLLNLSGSAVVFISALASDLLLGTLTPAADRVPYFTGATTADLATFTAGGRALVNSAGTADTFPYFSASNTVTLGAITAAGRALLDDADATAQRATLGLVIGTNVQAFDAELSAIAGLTSVADRLPYFTGSGTAALATFTAGGRALVNSAGTANTFPYFSASNTVTLGALTAGGRALINVAGTIDTFPYFSASNVVTLGSITAAGRALIDDADAAAQRTTLGLAIGTNVQAYDADLAAIAGLTSAADALPYFTGIGTAATTTLTTFGRSLIDDATASDARTTLGLAIGTNVQAYDADLAAIAGVTSAANKVPYFTGAGTASVEDFIVAAANTSHTPVVTCQTGSITSYTSSSSYMRVGKLVFWTINVTLTNAGTGAGQLYATMPFNAAAFAMGFGEEYASIGFDVKGKVSGGSNSLAITKMDGTTAIATSNGFRVSGTYQV